MIMPVSLEHQGSRQTIIAATVSTFHQQFISHIVLKSVIYLKKFCLVRLCVSLTRYNGTMKIG